MVNFRPSAARGPFRVQAWLAAALLLCVAAGVGVVAQTKRDFNVSAKKFRFTVSGTDAQEIRVSQDDLVRITLSSEDIPHSFTLPDYRIRNVWSRAATSCLSSGPRRPAASSSTVP